MALAGGSILGLGSLVFYGLGFSNEEGAVERYAVWPQYVKERISSTYSYLGGGLGITALSAYAASKSQPIMRLASSSSLVVLFGSMAALIGSGM